MGLGKIENQTELSPNAVLCDEEGGFIQLSW